MKHHSYCKSLFQNKGILPKHTIIKKPCIYFYFRKKNQYEKFQTKCFISAEIGVTVSNSSSTHGGGKGSSLWECWGRAESCPVPVAAQQRLSEQTQTAMCKHLPETFWPSREPWSASRPRAVNRKSLPLILRALCSALQCLFTCNPSYSASFQPGQTSKHELQWKLECIQMLLALQKWSQTHTKKPCLTDRNMLISQKLCSIKWQC